MYSLDARLVTNGKVSHGPSRHAPGRRIELWSGIFSRDDRALGAHRRSEGRHLFGVPAFGISGAVVQSSAATPSSGI